ncbi:hypothetical protein A6F57_19670 [Alteromonas stellipolaris]|uniref:DUF2303 family protein n=1 Tax=Alteromonas stellipolaris TaxID=233316 RepID=UPI0007B45796|nr:DUF2303 family protein [Alteromonas stellipolaris]ANB27201.1 hypothetical protein A6F57_19670 [Alteromonas stellipolaris]
MFDRDTLLELQKSELNKQLNSQLLDTAALFQEEAIPAMLVPENFSVVGFENRLEHRTRFRGLFSTEDIKSFVAYVTDYVGDETPLYANSQVFVNGDSMSATAILNVGDLIVPGHCDHTAKLSIPKTAAFKALQSVCGHRQGQQELSDFIEDWKDRITVEGMSGEQMNLSVAINAVRTVTVERVREIESSIDQFENSASVMEREAAKNKKDLPAYINFTCVPYAGLSEVTFKIRVSMLTGDVRIGFTLRVVGQEEHDEQIAEEFKQKININLNELPVEVFIGGFKP